MPSEKTRRFTRLLRTQQQLERGVEWRYAEARANRLAAERESAAAAVEIDLARDRRSLAVSAAFSKAIALSGFASEAAAEQRLAEKQAKVAECLRVEREIEAVLTAMRVKTKQWEKLQESAALVDAEEDLQALQRSWDEHGIRSHISEAAIPLETLRAESES
jgi:hypothetical protein